MLTLFGNLDSGNVHKVQLILQPAGREFDRVNVSQSDGDTQRPEFLAINPMGKVPTLVFDDGDVLSESGAILYFFGAKTGLWPEDKRVRAETLRWTFFEQYMHEPTLAVLRYLKRFTGRSRGIRVPFPRPYEGRPPRARRDGSRAGPTSLDRVLARIARGLRAVPLHPVGRRVRGRADAVFVVESMAR